MNNSIEILKKLIQEEKEEYDKVMDQYIPLHLLKETIEKTIRHYEEALALKTQGVELESDFPSDQKIKQPLPPIPPLPEKPVELKGSQADFVRELMNEIGFEEEFSFKTLSKMAAKKIPGIKLSRNVLNNVSKQKIDNNEIEVTKRGKGRAPNIYQKIQKLPTRRTLY